MSEGGVHVKTDLENELPLKPYLLGELKPEDQQRLEQRLMIDTAVFEELQRAEDELIDDYLRGALSGRERERFETFFLLAPERLQKLSFAKTLKRYVADHPTKESRWVAWWETWLAFWRSQNPVLRWSLATAILMIIAGGSWTSIRVSRLQKALEQAGARDVRKQLMEMQTRNSELAAALQREQSQRGSLEQQVANLKTGEKPGHPSPLPSQLQPALLSFALTPGLLRDMGSSQKINISLGTSLVQLELNMVAEVYPRYRAVLQTVDGDEIWTLIWPKTESTGQGHPLRLILPAKLLTRGDYILKLSGMTTSGDFEDIGNYSFRVIQM